MGLGAWRAGLHRAVDAADRRFGTVLRASSLSASAWTAVLDAVVGQQPDRLYMRRTILPALARAAPHRILFVGVRGYTRPYARAFRGTATEFWTSDIDPAVARYGSPSRHVTEDVRELHAAFPPEFFDVVMLNGVFGWGVDRAEDMERALAAIEQVLAPGGRLMIGWNSDRVPDPGTLSRMGSFKAAGYAGLPRRKAFQDVTHVYGWYRKLHARGSGATGKTG